MKQFLLLLILLPQWLGAQVDFNYVSPLYGTNYAAVAINASGNIVGVGSENRYCAQRLVDFFDKNGQHKWQAQGVSHGNRLNAATDVLFDQTGDIVVVGANRPGYDVVLDSNDSIYILKLDSMGQTLLEQNYYVESSTFSTRPLVIELKDSVYVIGVDDRLFWLDQAGSLLKEQTIEVDRIDGLSSSANNHFTVLSSEKAILFDENGAELAVFEAADSPFLAVEQANDTTYLLSKNELIAVYDAANIRNIVLPGRLEQGWMSSGVNGAALTILYQFGENQASIIKYQQLWDTIQLQLPLGDVITDLATFGNQYCFIGRDQWGATMNPFQGAYLSVTSPEIARSTIIQEDLSLTAVNIRSIGMVDTFDQIPDWQNPDSIIAFGIAGLFEVTFDIDNIGSNTVNNFVLFSESFAGFNCVENRLYEQLENVEIASGETFSYSTTFRVSASFAPNDVLVNGINICFSLAAPNRKFDQQNSNNHFCTALLTRTQDEFILNDQLKVFPNPAHTSLQIELTSNDPIQQIHLFDLQGKLQVLDSNIQGQSAQIHRGSLSSGIYLLKVYTKNGVGSQKIIFQ